MEETNTLYAQIFGLEHRPNIYALDDEDYNEFRQHIINAEREHYDKSKLPFDGIRLPKQKKQQSCANIKQHDNANPPTLPTKHLFYIRNKECNASGYYDEKHKSFYICEGSILSYNGEHTSLATYRKYLIDTLCKVDPQGNAVTKRDIGYRNASAAASDVLGRPALYSQWKDAHGKNPKDIYPDLFSKTSRL